MIHKKYIIYERRKKMNTKEWKENVQTMKDKKKLSFSQWFSFRLTSMYAIYSFWVWLLCDFHNLCSVQYDLACQTLRLSKFILFTE